MAAFLDACRFSPTLGGTTDWTVSAAVGGYMAPASANVVNGKAYKYRAESADLSQWEIGEGTFNTGTGVLSRTTVLFNSSGGTSKINFSTVPQVAIVGLAEDVPALTENNTFSGVNTFSNSTASVSTTTGAVKVAGGLGVQGAVHANALAAHVAPNVGWGIDCSACIATVPGGGSYVLSDNVGMIILTDQTSSGQTGVYLNGGSATAAAAFIGGGSAFVAPSTAPATNKYAIGFDGTHWRIYNGNASAITFNVATILTRPNAV